MRCQNICPGLLRLVFYVLLSISSTVLLAQTEGKALDKAFILANQGNQQAAIKIWEELAETGNPTALYNLSLAYEKGIGVNTDLDKSFKLCFQAAEKGEVLAMSQLGTKYKVGIGVPIDIEMAEKWYKKAASNNDVRAQVALGYLYASPEGHNNFQEAYKYWSLAAQNGDALSGFNLGLMYQRGIARIPDINKAIALYSASAEAGSIEAMANLVALYAEGSRVEKNYYKAYFWCDISVAAGLEENREALAFFKSKLTHQQLEKVKKDIQNWHKTKSQRSLPILLKNEISGTDKQ